MRVSPGVQTTLDVGGEPVLLTGPPAWVEWLSDQYGTEWKGDPPSPTITIESDQPPMLPADEPNDRDGDGYDVWWHEDELHVSRRGFTAWMRRGAPSRVVIGSSGHDIDRNMLRYSQYGMAWCLARADRMLLHCAQVSDGERAVLLLGPTGVGKSTAVVAALRAGLTVHGDDLVVVRNDGALSATGLARHLVAPVDMVMAAGLDPFVIDETDTGGRPRVVLSRELRSDGSPSVTATVLLGHHHAGGAFDLIEQAERAAAITHGYAMPPFPPVLRSHFPMMARLAELPMWQLKHARDEGRRLDFAAAAIEKAIRESP